MIFYTNRFVTEGFAGCARGPFIFIRPQYMTDVGLREHEKVHRRQWLRTLGLHSFLYLLVPKYRLASEVEAYKEQLRYNPGRAELYAVFISTKYKLPIAQDAALRLLMEP